MNGSGNFDWLGNSNANLSNPTTLQQLASSNNFSLDNSNAMNNPQTMMANSSSNAPNTAGINAQVPQLSLEQIANINMLHQMGRGDIANQLVKQYGASLPEESMWTKAKNILTGSPDASLSGWQQGLQSALPVGLTLFKLLSTNNFIKNNPAYMTGLAASQQPQLQAAVKPH